MNQLAKGQVFLEFERFGRILTQENLAIFWMLTEGRRVAVKLWDLKKILRGKLLNCQADVIVIEEDIRGKRIVQLQEIERLSVSKDKSSISEQPFFDPIRTPIDIPEYDA